MLGLVGMPSWFAGVCEDVSWSTSMGEPLSIDSGMYGRTDVHAAQNVSTSAWEIDPVLEMENMTWSSAFSSTWSGPFDSLIPPCNTACDNCTNGWSHCWMHEAGVHQKDQRGNEYGHYKRGNRGESRNCECALSDIGVFKCFLPLMIGWVEVWSLLMLSLEKEEKEQRREWERRWQWHSQDNQEGLPLPSPSDQLHRSKCGSTDAALNSGNWIHSMIQKLLQTGRWTSGEWVKVACPYVVLQMEPHKNQVSDRGVDMLTPTLYTELYLMWYIVQGGNWVWSCSKTCVAGGAS